MAVFRNEKTRDYTVMSNHHLRSKALSLKAKGLLSLMLSLPDDWDYTLNGLARICKEGVDSIGGIVRELEAAGYIQRRRIRNAKGQLTEIEYTISEQPEPEKPERENPVLDNPSLDCPKQAEPVQEKSAQLNINQPITQKQNTNLQIHPSIQDDTIDGCDEAALKEQLGYEELLLRYPNDSVDSLYELIADTLRSRAKSIRIGGCDVPAWLVQDRFRRLDSTHLEYVIDSLRKTTTSITNIRGYLLTALYNAAVTIDPYYAAAVRHDESG